MQENLLLQEELHQIENELLYAQDEKDKEQLKKSLEATLLSNLSSLSERQLKKLYEIYTLTRGTKTTIKEAIQETGSDNRNILCAKVAEILETKYIGLNFDYQIKRMKLVTTKQILFAIDFYFYKHFTPSDFNGTDDFEDDNQCN